jgi:hypothetical protein
MIKKLSLVALLFASACSVELAGNPAKKCTDGCSATEECYEGFCLPLPNGDAGPVDLGLPDSGERDPLDCSEFEDGEIVSCYTGAPASSQTMGACRPGAKECRNGKFGGCLLEVTPSAESCNGRDDDCNGEIDDIPPTSCAVEGALGVCRDGTLQCVGSNPTCVSTSSATLERCGDALDNDCDGAVNEDLVRPCYSRAPDGCVQDRKDGKFTCVGSCQAGTQACELDGSWSTCAKETIPNDIEECTTSTASLAQDENCNGEIDEGCTCVEGASYACYDGPLETNRLPCRSGLALCTSDQFGKCDGQILPETETCANEGADDDCDGMPDDVLGRGDACSTAQLGACRDGVSICGTSGPECLTPMAVPELCNGLDDDCNGVNDNGFDLLTDRNHCGECNDPCPEGLDCCGGNCIDLQMDGNNCGECTEACGQGGLCCDGQCVANPLTDRNNCGGCGIPCNGEGQACCNGTCVDTRTNPATCGNCTTQCSGMNSACCDSVCAPPISAQCDTCGETCDPNETCCAPVCADTMTDTFNCGGCGIECAAGQFCCNGMCRANDEANCGMCGRSCGANEHCCGGTCVPVNAQNCLDCGDTCLNGQSCCGTAGCQPTDVDPHCGACGVNCAAAGQQCSNRTCCAAGLTGCEGSCANLANDVDNCGQCGRSCTGLLGIGATCSSARCCITVLFITTCQ